MTEASPLVSVVIPFLNASETLGRTLESVISSTYENYQLVTVDDGSTDMSAEIALKYPGIHVAMTKTSGAAMARNEGVKASSGSIIFFIDADVTVQPHTISEVVRTFQNNPGIAACFGEYTPMPFGDNFATVYKNLVHHFTHQTSSERARTFWCGCGAIKKEAFETVGGFDESFVAASVEDIDLGYRLHALKYQILLNKNIQVTHGKHYTMSSLIKSDLFYRAIPWTKLMASRNVFFADLNLKWNNIASGLALFCFPPLFIAASVSFGWSKTWWVLLVAFAFYLILNRKIIDFVIRKKGLLFSVPFLAMYTLTYVYSSIGFGVGMLAFIRDRIFGKRQTE